MNAPHAKDLRTKQCVPCEGGVRRYTMPQVVEQLKEFPDWQVVENGSRIYRHWVFHDFCSAFSFIGTVAELAEQEQHHPDFHLTRYRHVRIELYTHAVDGLSENDFILAAKIDAAVLNE